MRSKRASIEISFGMIFSIILIIAFVAIAFYVIKNFMNTAECAQVGVFKEDLQSKIDSAFSSSEYSKLESMSLNKNTRFVCFADKSSGKRGNWKEYYDELVKYSYGDKNMFFYPAKSVCSGLQSINLEHLNITRTTLTNNPYCVENVNGKVQLRLTKSFYDSLVCIGNNCGGGTATMANENVCRTAINSNLCNALDTGYRIGYKQACCNEYGKCC